MKANAFVLHMGIQANFNMLMEIYFSRSLINFFGLVFIFEPEQEIQLHKLNMIFNMFWTAQKGQRTI